VYYPVPLHLQTCFSELGGSEGDLPVSERLCGEVMSLPIFPELGEDRIDEVAGAIREFFGAGSGD
jgi:dTDP-4-amino-4,6-dideoxygalactose transaminase